MSDDELSDTEVLMRKVEEGWKLTEKVFSVKCHNPRMYLDILGSVLGFGAHLLHQSPKPSNFSVMINLLAHVTGLTNQLHTWQTLGVKELLKQHNLALWIG